MLTTAGARRLRVVIADDHPSIRENLRYLMGAEPDLEVVGVAQDGVSALRLALNLHPDVLVIDYDLPDYDGLTVTRALRRDTSKIRVVLYTMKSDVCSYATHSGVDACVSKDSPPTALLDSIRSLGRRVSRKRPRVLVVEDDADVRSSIRTALEEDGLEIVETGDGVEALAEYERERPRVVVLDLGLPRMSGQDFVAAYRHLPGQAAPIVVVSALRNARQIAKDLGAAAFVPKPFSVSELSEAVLRLAPT